MPPQADQDLRVSQPAARQGYLGDQIAVSRENDRNRRLRGDERVNHLDDRVQKSFGTTNGRFHEFNYK